MLLASFVSIGKAQNTLPFSFDFEDGWPEELEMKKDNQTNYDFCIDIAEDPSEINGMSLRYSRARNTWRRRVQLTDAINLNGAHGVIVSFDWRHQTDILPNRTDHVQVQYSTDGGSTWNNVGNPVYRYTNIIPYGTEMDDDGDDFWQHYSFSIPQVANQTNVKIGLLFNSNSAGLNNQITYSYLDNLEIEVAEDDCFPPTNVRVYNVTGDAATVAWTDNSGASSWRIQYDGGLMVTADNPCTVYYLESGTPYSLSVGVWCTSASAWSFSEEVEFETQPCASTHEVYYDFEDDISECVILKRTTQISDPELEYTVDDHGFETVDAEGEGDYGLGRTGNVLKFYDDYDSDIVQSRFILPTLDMRGYANGATIDFMWYHQTGNNNNSDYNDYVQVEYSTDGISWYSLSDKVYRSDAYFGVGWKQYRFAVPQVGGTYGTYVALLFSKGIDDENNEIYRTLYMDDLHVYPTNTMPAPMNLTANPTAEGAFVSWTEMGHAQEWTVVWVGESMLDFDEYPILSDAIEAYMVENDEYYMTVENTATFIPLDDTYEIYVRAENNGNHSPWSLKCKVELSECEAQTLDWETYIQDFANFSEIDEEEDEDYETYLAEALAEACLNGYKVSGSGRTGFNFGGINEDDDNIHLTFNTENGSEACLVLPAFDLRESESGTGIMVGFNWYHQYLMHDNTSVQVKYTLDGFNWTNVGAPVMLAGDNDEWKKYEFYIEEFEGAYGLVGLFFSQRGYATCYLDDIRVAANECYRPEELTVESVMGNSATLTWEAGDASIWQVVYGTYDPEYPVYNPEDMSEYDEYIYDDPTVTLQDLDTQEHYAVFVRAVCDEDNDVFSDWSEVATFATDPCEANTLDYALDYDFEGLSELEELECVNITVEEGEDEPGLYFDMLEGESNTRLVFAPSEEGQVVRLTLPALDMRESEYGGVLVSFEWYHNGEEENEDMVELQYSLDGNDWETVDAEVYRYADYQGWRTYHFVVEDIIGEMGYISLLFTDDGEGECYLDDLKIEAADAHTWFIVEDTEWEDDIDNYTFITVLDGVTLTLTGSNYGSAANIVLEDGAQLMTSEATDVTMIKNIDAYDPDAEEPDGYRLIASPTDLPVVTNLFYNEFDFYYYDNTEDEEWRNYKDTEFDIEPTKGYLYANDHNVALRFAGTVPSSEDDIDVDIYDNELSPMGEWNLIGNPFASSSYIDYPFYRMNAEGSELEAVNGGEVYPMEGIFMKADNTSLTSVTFKTEDSDLISELCLTLKRDRGTVIDRAIVSLGEGMMLHKFMLHPENTRIYFRQNDTDYAIVRSQTEGEMPVSFKAAQNGTYTLTVETKAVEVGYLHLIDNLTGADVDLLQTPNYTFEARTTDYASRFRLVFNANSIGEDTLGDNEAFAFFNGSTWTIANEGQSELQVIDVMGRVVRSESISGNAELNLNQASGVYMLRLINGDSVRVQKVVVR